MKIVQVIILIAVVAMLGVLGLVFYSDDKKDKLQNELKGLIARHGKLQKEYDKIEIKKNGTETTEFNNKKE